MPRTSIIFGVLLIAVSFSAYFLSDGRSLTSFIPAVFGLVLLVCGVIAQKGEKARKHALHVAALFSFVGMLAAGTRLPKSIAKYTETEGASLIAVLGQGSMAILCLLFFAICLRSFIVARMNRSY